MHNNDKSIWKKRLNGGTGIAFKLLRGQRMRIIDVSGKQVGDLVVFLLDNHYERLSQGNTRKLNNTWLVSVGHRLYSTRCQSLLKIVQDTVGRHDLQSSACSPYDYIIRFGVTNHPSCLDNLSKALKPFNIEEYLIPDPLNVFMNTSISENGEIDIREPLSRRGDYIEFLAEEDVLIGLSCCPQDQNACNGNEITDLDVELFDKD